MNRTHITIYMGTEHSLVVEWQEKSFHWESGGYMGDTARSKHWYEGLCKIRRCSDGGDVLFFKFITKKHDDELGGSFESQFFTLKNNASTKEVMHEEVMKRIIEFENKLQKEAGLYVALEIDVSLLF